MQRQPFGAAAFSWIQGALTSMQPTALGYRWREKNVVEAILI